MAQTMLFPWSITYVYRALDGELKKGTILLYDQNHQVALTQGLIRARDICAEFHAEFIGVQNIEIDNSFAPRTLSAA